MHAVNPASHSRPAGPPHKPGDNDNDDPPAVPMPQQIPMPIPLRQD